MKRNYIILDTETGGLNPLENSLLSMGMVFVKDGKIVEKKEWFFKLENYKVSPYAMKVNKLNLWEVYEKGTVPAQIAYEFKQTVKRIYGEDKPSFIGHNVSFDIGFIHNNFIPKAEIDKFVSYRNIDTVAIARFLIDIGLIDSTKADLSTLIEYFHIDTDVENNIYRHTALYDATMTWRVYIELVKLAKGMK